MGPGRRRGREDRVPLPWRNLRASHQIVVGAAVGIAILLSSFAYDQWRHYHESLQETEKSTLSTARLLAEYTARTFNAAAGALRAVARRPRAHERGRPARAPGPRRSD